MTFADYVRKYHMEDNIDSVRQIAKIINDEPDFQYVTDKDDVSKLVNLIPSHGNDGDDKTFKDVFRLLFREYYRSEFDKRIHWRRKYSHDNWELPCLPNQRTRRKNEHDD